MNPLEVRSFLDQAPFRPFRVTMVNGNCYDIVHPGLAMVCRTTLMVGIVNGPMRYPIADHWALLALAHVREIRFLDAEPRS